MSQDQKFQQRWEFRRRGDDNDSSSNDSKSSARGEPVEKKHKLVSNLILLDNDETSDTPRSQWKGQPDYGKGINVDFGKANRTHMGLRNRTKKKAIKNKTKRGSKKKSKHSNQDPVSLDAFKIFMESILEDVKVARENMFARMREEMKKLVAVESASRTIRKEGSCVQKTEQAPHQNSTGLGIKTQNCKGGSLERSVLSNRMADSNNCYKVLEEPFNHDQAIETVTSNEKEKGERLRLYVKKSKYSSNHSDQTIPSSYLTLPSVLRQVEHHKSDYSSRNCIHPGVAGNDTNVNFGRENLMIDASTHHSYFSGVQAEEPFGSFAQMGSKNMGFYDQHSTQVSTIGTGFPVHHQRLDNSSIIPSQVVLENTFRDSNTLGRRMNGGSLTLSGGSHALSDHYVAIRNHMNYKADDGLMTYGTHDLKDCHLYPH